MKKLLICSPSNALFGGVETIVNDLCRELPRRGWDPLLALGKGARFNNISAYRDRYDSLPIVELDGTKGTRQARTEALRQLMERSKPDLVLTARIFDVYPVVRDLKNANSPVRFAVTVQAYEPPYFADLRNYRNIVDVCITSGELIRLAAIDWCGLASDRVISIPGGVTPPSRPVNVRKTSQKIRLCYIGRLDQEQKRVFDLMPLLRALDKRQVDYTLGVVGTGPCEADLMAMLEPWKEKGRVTFYGWRSKEQLYGNTFENFDCLVHLAHTEGVTIAPREAMAHGIVPVISQFTGLRAEHHFVSDWNALTFPVGDMTTAAAQIHRLIKEPGLLEKLSRNAMASQTGKYTFDGSMDAWAKAFDWCLAQPRSTGRTQPHVYSDGRLDKLGIPPRLAQRLRDVLGRRYIHTNPGSEWPTSSGVITDDLRSEIEQFALHAEDGGCAKPRLSR